MIDFERIGKRILEERKYLRRISQERMAEDLGMYQADISNLEKAKSGSGITDLSKLDLIADYFDMPLETLLFGRRQDQMEKYYGSKMQLKEFSKKLTRKHESILRNLIGNQGQDENNEALKDVLSYECGPYMVYVFFEKQIVVSGTNKPEDSPEQNLLLKAHIYVVYQDEVIGCTIADITTMMQHLYMPTVEKMRLLIMPDIFDIYETLSILDPYWLLWKYAVTDEEKEEFGDQMIQRMEDLGKAGEERTIIYIESAYVREDCRRNGILRMMVDILKRIYNSPLLWLSLEPTSGEELSSEYSFHAMYQASELGQLNLNASIAERLGFTIDSKTYDCQTERIEEDGNLVIETVPVRRTAYFLPQKVRSILNGDGDLLAYARARKKTLGGDVEKPKIIDVFQGSWKKFGFIMSIKLVYSNETVFAFARGMDWKSRWLGVSKDNPAPTGEFVDTLEKYDNLRKAENSKYYLGLKVAEELLGAIFFGTVKPEDVHLNDLQ